MAAMDRLKELSARRKRSAAEGGLFFDTQEHIRSGSGFASPALFPAVAGSSSSSSSSSSGASEALSVRIAAKVDADWAVSSSSNRSNEEHKRVADEETSGVITAAEEWRSEIDSRRNDFRRKRLAEDMNAARARGGRRSQSVMAITNGETSVKHSSAGFTGSAQRAGASSAASLSLATILPPSADSGKQDSDAERRRFLRGDAAGFAAGSTQSETIAMRKNPYLFEQGRRDGGPQWHAPWELFRVISGHTGWVRSIAVDPNNEWFVTGSVDRTIKVWDLASGTLRLTLTGHIGAVRGLAVSERSPYLFSAGDDKMVKCWDLETNKVIRSYHGHLSGVYCLDLHPALDILVTAGRDAVARVWDIRTKNQIHVLGGHSHTVGSVKCQSSDPQIITGSQDTTVRLWDIRKGSCAVQLTHHKKSVRALALHPHEFTFVSGAADNLKKWKFPDGNFMHNLSGHNAVVNCLAVNEDGVLVSGADNGSMHFWDYKTGYNFQQVATIVQPGSLEAEAGILTTEFDRTGMRLIVGEADKTIKMYREVADATPETHPVGDWKKQLKSDR